MSDARNDVVDAARKVCEQFAHPHFVDNWVSPVQELRQALARLDAENAPGYCVYCDTTIAHHVSTVWQGKCRRCGKERDEHPDRPEIPTAPIEGDA